MAKTIDYNVFRYWDANGSFPGENVGDAFMRAGGKVEYVDSCEVIVRGLRYVETDRIAKQYQADFLGPVEGKDPDLKHIKTVSGFADRNCLVISI